jgi:branched-chain amino acid transport system ATP-binding protein
VPEAILKLEDVHVFIGRHHILQGLSLEARADGVTVLIGRNGAGKSTTLRTIMGLASPSRGRILYQGEEIQRKKPYAIARSGIGFVPEERGIFSNLTVEENMRVAMFQENRASHTRLEGVLKTFPVLEKFWLKKAGTLSGGQKQILAIARALVNDIGLLLIDEPTKGLAPIVVETLVQAIDDIKKSNVVVLVEQNFHMASAVGDHFHILDDGRAVKSGPMTELIDDQELKSKYLGISRAIDG